VFAPAHLAATIDQIMAGQQAGGTDHAAAQVATARIEEAAAKMASYRAALDAGGDPEEIGKWIAEAKAQRLAAEAQLRQATSGAGPALSRQQIRAVTEECADIARDLSQADPADLANAYSKLGLRLIYHPGRNLVQATASPRAANIGK
jgi:site-specific DNA recombinase